MISSAFAANVYGQPVEIGEGHLLNAYLDYKIVPIQKHLDTLYAAGRGDSEPWCAIGIPQQGHCDWGIWYSIPTYENGLEFYIGNSGDHYFYSASTNIFFYWLMEPYFLFERDCPGRPVLDSENNIHLIWEGNGDTLYYGVSSDTLASYGSVDTLINPYGNFRLVTSPDNYYVGAYFVDSETDSLYKYLGIAGGRIDFSEPSGVFPCSLESANSIYDATLDSEGNLYYVSKFGRGGNWWEMEYFWSEQYGYRYLRDGDDDVLMGINYEITFGPEYGEIMLIRSEWSPYSNGSSFFISLDDGDSWFSSEFICDGNGGSALRTYGDSIDFVYSDEGHAYYYGITRDSVLYEMTSISESGINAPVTFSMSNYPNPFNAGTSIEFTLSKPSNVILTIYNIAGELVKEFRLERQDAGLHIVYWQGRDNRDKPISSGIYFYKMKTDGHSTTRKMLLLK